MGRALGESLGVQRLELLSRFCESLLAELQANVIAMSFACALCLCCVLRSCGSANLLLLLQSRQIVKARDQA